MKRLIKKLCVVSLLLTGCSKGEKTLYHSKDFSLFQDRVVQGKFEAKAISDREIVSNYKSPANDQLSPLVLFKFSINGKDNEFEPGKDHRMFAGKSLPLYAFGEINPQESKWKVKKETLKPNTKVTLKMDGRKVLESFKKQGFYVTPTGAKIYKQDFKGFYVAGSQDPLNWDFDNLSGNKSMEMTDPDGDGIYTLDLVMNPYNPNNFVSQEWKLNNDVSAYPQYQSGQLLVDALYNMSLDETVMNIEKDGTFRTGAKWPGVWTRDVSYSILLAYAMIEPEVAKTSLLRKVKRNRIIQDTGTGGAWPVSSDRTTWALAAYEVYKATGDKEWLKQAFEIIRNSVRDDEKTILDEQTGLRKGESSFLDWRKQEYPLWANNVDIYDSECLGTNAVHFRAYDILAEMAELLGEDAAPYRQGAEQIKSGLNKYLWQADKGYYGMYLYGREYLNLDQRPEMLGGAFTVLFGIADAKQAGELIAKTPVVPFGTPCFYPQIPGILPYHNNGIWPFVQAYWNWASAKTGNYKSLNHGLASLYRAAGLFLTNKENMVAQNGDFRDTQINSDRQLWSVAGNLAMVYRVFFGMEMTPNSLKFAPVVPEEYAGKRSLKNFRYRKAVLNISMEGFGNQIESFKLDGKELENAEIPANLEGAHTVEIVLKSVIKDQGSLNVQPNRFTLETPKVELDNGKLEVVNFDPKASYELWVNGKRVQKSKKKTFDLKKTGQYAEYQVTAVDAHGYRSFYSEPVVIVPKGDERIYQMETFAPKARLPYKGYHGRGFVEITKKKNLNIKMPVAVKESGLYAISFRYANGSGPYNTDNKCAIRSLLVDKQFKGTVVMSQLAKDEWSLWSQSNSVVAELSKGKHMLELKFLPFNENMNVEVNRAMLDQMRIVKIK